MRYPPSVIPWRDREARDNSCVRSAFTMRELDAIAPLEPQDQNDLIVYAMPLPGTRNRMQARIEAARKLKYGR